MKYYLSIDISTSNAGFTVFDSGYKLADYRHLQLTIDKDTVKENKEYKKAEIFKKYLSEIKEQYPTIEAVYIEKSLISSNNINTATMLTSFNAICRYIILQELNIIPTQITVSDSRKIFLAEHCINKKIKGVITSVLSFPAEFKDNKKEFIRQKVARLEPSIIWIYKKNGSISDLSYDISDSYCVGYAGMIINNIKS